ncbi:NADPH:quinone reductase [Streptomyces sp. ICBB 8177]|uniref:NADPH:quinone reductase n=1 Tax=Streptomyces sp. ICBB 8177 TaxID=563922 RepID=UPI000D67C358|nr:NADPH:quinone reductase [Streptomyces sp. ICBB 8177]PWI41906.1 NADPH:quinone reductase [Streptomyces sp. ICBB 8177]
MKSIVYTQHGGPEVLSLVERPLPEPGPGEVRVKVHVSGVNPTDWKSRATPMRPLPEDGGGQVPNQDGAGVVDAVGEGVPASRVGERVWLYLAAYGSGHGSAQEYTVIPQHRAVPLPEGASFDVGASLGVPALTAHRCLTVAEDGPRRLAPGALTGRTVLVAGGAGAVGNCAIQLARWAGATVVTTISSDRKARLARAAGAHHIVNYRTEKADEAIREAAPDGVDIVVEVSPAMNAGLDVAVTANNAAIAYYANNGGDEVTIPLRESFSRNLRWQGVLLYNVPDEALAAAVEAVSAAVADGALRVGEEAGLPLHRYPLDRTGDAHTAVEEGAVGKVLIDVAGA